MLLPILFTLTLLILPLLTLRLLTLLNPHPPSPRRPHTPTRILIVLGSGGHTSEMLSLLRYLNTSKYSHRSYVLSSGDPFSAQRARAFESDVLGATSTVDITIVPRAREIHQSLLSTPLSAIRCLQACFTMLRGDGEWPDLILSNGPGTGVIVILASLMLRFVAWPGTTGKMRTIYVESWARVRSLSLSGKILLRIVDRFVVQWEPLLEVTGKKGEYLGQLI